MFFILDEQIKPDLIRIERLKQSFAVLDVINLKSKKLSISSGESSSDSSDSSEYESSSLSVSNRMVEQFLEAVNFQDDFKPRYTSSEL